MLQINPNFLIDMLSGGSALLPADVRLDLFKNDIYPGPEAAVTDFEKADFTGYVSPAAAPVWFNATAAENGGAGIRTEETEFRPTYPTTVSNTIYGWYLHNNMTVFASERFEDPVLLSTMNDAVYGKARLAILPGP